MDLVCKICKKKCNTNRGLAIHISKSHKINFKDYIIKYFYSNNTPLCRCGCEKPVTFFRGKFRDFLPGHASRTDDIRKVINSKEANEKRIKTNIKKYGGPAPACSKKVIDKMKNTCMAKYGTTSPFSNESVKEKIKKTNLSRHGYENPFSSEHIKEKIKKININKYGVEYAVQNEQVKKKIKETNLKKYGTESVFSNEKIREKIEKTFLNKYGVRHVSQTESVKEKKKVTNLKKYGVICSLQADVIKEKIRKTRLKKYGIDHHMKSEDFVIKIKKQKYLTFSKISEICKQKQYTPLFMHDEYEGYKKVMPFRCEKHNVEFQTSIFNIAQTPDSQCPRCKTSGVSKPEKEIAKFIRDNDFKVVLNTRDVIKPKEIDIYISSKNIGIEYHGLFWHSEKNPYFINPKLHFEKFELARKADVRLLQFFEDEWRDKQEICKSIIANILGKSKRVYARKCESLPVNKKLEKQFLNDNHLQGFTNSFFCHGLFYDGELVMLISVRKPFTKDKTGSVEIARVCSKRNVIVVGGFSKLMKEIKSWVKEQGFDKIVTYSDCRYSFGETYEKYGFSFVKYTGLDYFYTDGCIRYNRFKFRAKNGLTEKQVADNNGVSKIYGAGNYLWQIDL